jgi:hypothetical protein
MMLPKLAACLLLGLAGAGFAQDTGRKKPPRPIRPDPFAKNEPVRSLIKLPDDFVQYARLPEGGLRPRLALGKNGLGLIYSTGEGPLGDLFLVYSRDEAKTFSAGVRVNAEPGTVLSWNRTQSASIGVGPDDRFHVAWVSGGEKPSLQYVRTTPEGELEAVRDLGAPSGLGTTTAVTVDARGQVFLVYSAGGPTPDVSGNPGARIWLRRSTDGVSFTEPVTIDPNLNVSVHSEIAAHVDEIMGTVFVLYRTAYQVKEDSPIVSRSMRLLHSEDDGMSFSPSLVDNWKHQHDPHSSSGLTQEKNSTLAAWDADGSVCWSIIRRQVKQSNLPVAARSKTKDVSQTHAAGAAGGNEVILTWLERPEKEPMAQPRLGWQVWMREGRAGLGDGYAPEPPTADGQVVFPRRAGGFTIIY